MSPKKWSKPIQSGTIVGGCDITGGGGGQRVRGVRMFCVAGGTNGEARADNVDVMACTGCGGRDGDVAVFPVEIVRPVSVEANALNALTCCLIIYATCNSLCHNWHNTTSYPLRVPT